MFLERWIHGSANGQYSFLLTTVASENICFSASSNAPINVAVKEEQKDESVEENAQVHSETVPFL